MDALQSRPKPRASSVGVAQFRPSMMLKRSRDDQMSRGTTIFLPLRGRRTNRRPTSRRGRARARTGSLRPAVLVAAVDRLADRFWDQ